MVVRNRKTKQTTQTRKKKVEQEFSSRLQLLWDLKPGSVKWTAPRRIEDKCEPSYQSYLVNKPGKLSVITQEVSLIKKYFNSRVLIIETRLLRSIITQLAYQLNSFLLIIILLLQGITIEGWDISNHNLIDNLVYYL